MSGGEWPTREAYADGSRPEPYAAYVGGLARPALYFPANARYRETRLLGPLWEGAPAAAGGGENFAAIRNISGYGKVLSLRPCGATSLAEGGRGEHFPANARYREPRGPDMSGPYCAFLNKIKTKGELHG